MRALVDPKKLTTTERKTLRAQCDGDWSRVTTDGPGSFMVHNNAARALAYVGSVPAKERRGKVIIPGPGKYGCPECLSAGKLTGFDRPDPLFEHRRKEHLVPARKAEKKRPAPPKKPVPDAQLRALKHMVETRPQKAAGGVAVVSAPERERVIDIVESPIDVTAAREFDWHQVDLEATTTRLHALCKGGLPAAIPFTFKPDVLALNGVDTDELTDVVRHPQRVEIRPETWSKEKRYTVLAFARGDIRVILGMQNPAKPAVIAAYWTSLLDRDRSTLRQTTGGGGSRGSSGLPSTVKAMARQLRAHGAQIEVDELHGAATTEVKYHGQSLGKVTIGPGATKQTVQSDYQRVIRKMHAIDQRAAAS